jgi:hypothetical protein
VPYFIECLAYVYKFVCAVLLVFHSFIDDIFYAVAFLLCGVGLSESKLMVWDPVLRVQVFIDFFLV